MKYTHCEHSANKDAASYHILIYVADSVLEYMYRQGTDIHGVDLCDIPETFGDEKDELPGIWNNMCSVR